MKANKEWGKWLITTANILCLQVLDLGGNNLQILPREVFSRHGLLNLQKLKLSNCKIGQIDPTAFRGMIFINACGPVNHIVKFNH